MSTPSLHPLDITETDTETETETETETKTETKPKPRDTFAKAFDISPAARPLALEEGRLNDSETANPD